MATCEYCGSQVPDNAKFCTSCGAALQQAQPAQQVYEPPAYQQPTYEQPTYQQPTYQQPYQQPYQPASTPAVNDSGSIGWGILSFLFPIVGVILYFVWRNDKPNSAKVAGIGAIIGFCVNLVLNFTVLA